ncbi:MAG TPA: class I SAM-dependent methyltransferase [Thermoanaerobaculia bacterium]|nr:class I SAM-dependent methyltransferase [Thermoanaerobaculia bacterium]
MVSHITRTRMRFGRYTRLVWNGVPASPDHWQANWDDSDIAAMIAATANDLETRPLLDRYLKPGGRILEAGCGLGQWIIVLRRQGYRITGIDYVVDALRTSNRYQSGGSVMACADVARLPFPDATFDMICSFGVVEHFWNGPDAFIAEMVRVLRSGGTMLLSVPYLSALRKLKHRHVVEANEPSAFYQFGFDREEIVERLRAAGLRIETTRGISPVKGLKDEIALFGRMRRKLNAAAAPSVSVVAGSAKPRRRSWLGAVRRAAARLVYTRPVTSFAGHMLMVVCRKV